MTLNDSLTNLVRAADPADEEDIRLRMALAIALGASADALREGAPDAPSVMPGSGGRCDRPGWLPSGLARGAARHTVRRRPSPSLTTSWPTT